MTELRAVKYVGFVIVGLVALSGCSYLTVPSNEPKPPQDATYEYDRVRDQTTMNTRQMGLNITSDHGSDRPSAVVAINAKCPGLSTSCRPKTVSVVLVITSNRELLGGVFNLHTLYDGKRSNTPPGLYSQDILSSGRIMEILDFQIEAFLFESIVMSDSIMGSIGVMDFAWTDRDPARFFMQALNHGPGIE